MSIRSLTPVLFLLALSIAACNGSNKTTNTTNANARQTEVKTAATPDPLAATRGIYAKDCQNCHGAEGNGGPVKLEDGTKLKVPSLREGHALRHPDSDFVKQITKGGDGMPAFADKLKPEEINDLIKFIRSEFQGGQTPMK